MPTCLRRLVTTAAIATFCVPPPLAAQTPSLDDVLGRVATYLHDYVPRLARVVSSEDYEQRISVGTSGGPIVMNGGSAVSMGNGSETRLWRLKSEVLLVRYPLGDVDWM